MMWEERDLTSKENNAPVARILVRLKLSNTGTNGAIISMVVIVIESSLKVLSSRETLTIVEIC